MKTLILMRHAEFSCVNLDLFDIKRPLSERGNLTALLMGKLLIQHNTISAMLNSSHAKRSI